jgi:hypothetical protein
MLMIHALADSISFDDLETHCCSGGVVEHVGIGIGIIIESVS